MHQGLVDRTGAVAGADRTRSSGSTWRNSGCHGWVKLESGSDAPVHDDPSGPTKSSDGECRRMPKSRCCGAMRRSPTTARRSSKCGEPTTFDLATGASRWGTRACFAVLPAALVGMSTTWGRGRGARSCRVAVVIRCHFCDAARAEDRRRSPYCRRRRQRRTTRRVVQGAG